MSQVKIETQSRAPDGSVREEIWNPIQLEAMPVVDAKTKEIWLALRNEPAGRLIMIQCSRQSAESLIRAVNVALSGLDDLGGRKTLEVVK